MIPFTSFDRRGARRLMKTRRPAKIELMARELFSLGYAFESELQLDGRVRLDCARPEDTQTIADELVANVLSEIEEGFDRMIMFAYVRATRLRQRIATPVVAFRAIDR